MLQLLYSSTSPYARKVRVVLAEKHMECEVIEESPWAPGTLTERLNPLGKIPVLVLDDGTALYDSRVIVEYLDQASPVARLVPEPPRQRVAVRRLEALADGICDAALTVVLERKRPSAQQSPEWIDRQLGKIDAGLAELARDLGDKPWCSGDGYSLADIAAGCALGYLHLRHPGIDWRGRHPNLARLAEKLDRRPAFRDTAPPAA
jgi:glutathione S-transferase